MTDFHHDPETPLYDANQPIACTIEGGDVAAHVELIERIRGSLRGIERTPHGVILALTRTPGNVADLRQFAVEEQQCCAFWGFEVDERPDAALLRWDGPPDTAAFMDRLLDYFEGRLPIGALFGSP